MSDLITTTQDAYRNACLDAYFGARNFVASLEKRAKDEEGQTAAEYMGVLLLISVIIAAVVKSKPGEEIGRQIGTLVKKIAGVE